MTRSQLKNWNVEDGAKVVFDKVLVVGDGADIKVGAPYVDGVTVEGNAIETGKGKKVIIFKYKAKKDYRKKQGHRQPYTLVEITSSRRKRLHRQQLLRKKLPVEEKQELLRSRL